MMYRFVKITEIHKYRISPSDRQMLCWNPTGLKLLGLLGEMHPRGSLRSLLELVIKARYLVTCILNMFKNDVALFKKNQSSCTLVFKAFTAAPKDCKTSEAAALNLLV